MLTTKQALKNLILWVALGLALIAGVTILFDPFYQYHGVLPGMKDVLYEKETQVIGSIRNFSYDSVLLGSSVAENCDTAYLDEVYSIKTLKAIRASGSTADLLYYLDAAHEQRELHRVFYGLDLFALKKPCEVTVVSEYSPRYLYTDTILDDGAYLFNKDVLLKKIPMLLAYSVFDKNTGGHAYDWSEDKEFGTEKAMQAYDGPGEMASDFDFSGEKETIAENIGLLTEEIAGHPDVNYTFFFPPYSLLMWDDVCRRGEGTEYCYILGEVLPRLLAFDNVEVYYFQTDKDIVYNLDLYMDTMHYSPEINQYMLTSIAEKDDRYRLTRDNWQEAVTSLEQMCQEITQEEIYRYYPEN